MRSPEPSESSASTLTQIVLAIFRLNGALLAMGDGLVAPIGLTSARWQVLGAVSMAGSAVTVPDIARTMGLTRQAVQKQVDLLKAEGLLEARTNPKNARSPLLLVTARGRSLYAKAEAAWSRQANSLASIDSLKALRSALTVLHELEARLDNDEMHDTGEAP